MNRPVPLSTVYTAVQVIPSSRAFSYGSVDTLRNALGRKRSEPFEQRETVVPGIAIANAERFLNILGAPGAGKSTFLKRIGLEALLPRSSGEYEPATLPVYIELRRFKHEDVDLFRLIRDEFESCGLPDSTEFVALCLDKAKLLLLFDGVDEVPTEKLDRTIRAISDFADKFEKNRFITSCRTAFYKTFFQKFVDVELAPFDDDQVRTFVRNWFGSQVDRENRTADAFIRLLFSREHTSTLELARTPLLLTFLCLVFDDSQKLPANRSGLYRRALMILIEKWAAEKRVHNAPVYSDLHVELEMELLSEIAAQAYKNGQLVFSEQQLIEHISAFMKDTLNAPPQLDAHRILNAIEIQQGLLVERAPDVYSFSHLTIQEYLTAEFYHTPAKSRELLEQHLFNEKWREVFLLSAGMSGADDLLTGMFNICQRTLQRDEIARRCVDWMLALAPTATSVRDAVTLRLYLLSIPIRFKRYTEGRHERAEVIADEILDRFNPSLLRGKRGPKNWSVSSAKKWLRQWSEILMLKTPLSTAEEALDQIDRKYAERIVRNRYEIPRLINGVVCDALGLADDLRALHSAKARNLQRAFYGYELMIDCKDSALRVSASLWEEIIRRMGTLETVETIVEQKRGLNGKVTRRL
jgi:predicted NACHT family NTPase